MVWHVCVVWLRMRTCWRVSQGLPASILAKSFAFGLGLRSTPPATARKIEVGRKKAELRGIRDDFLLAVALPGCPGPSRPGQCRKFCRR